MTRYLPLLLMASIVSCMEMRETVERMVMVRTTGSDLQPAATGYIYKKKDDGLESVVKMNEDEVMEQLSKFYDDPKIFAAPLKEAEDSHNKEEDENKAESHSKEAYVIPVEEKQEENDDHDHDDDYSKQYNGYEDYKKDFANYFHNLGHIKNGIYHGHGEGNDGGSKGYHEYGGKEHKGHDSGHHYGKGDGEDYHTKKYATFYILGKGGHKKDYDDTDKYGKHYAEGHGEKGGDHEHKKAHSKGEKVEGFHKIYHKDQYDKDHDFYGNGVQKGGFHKFGDGQKYYGSNAGGHKKEGSHDSAHDEADFGKEGHHEKESGESHDAGHSAEEGEESEHHKHGDYGAKGEAFNGKSYGFEVKH